MAQNWNELFRFKADPSLESIKAGLREATGEDDFLGFNDVEDEQLYLTQMICDGSIERDGDYIIVNEIK